jgi:hypothetical protein
VARAKRTNRAEARRRYRATLIDDPELDDADEPSAEADDRSAPTPATRRGRAAASPTPAQAPRPSVLGALRGAFRPTDLRGDLAAMPRLLLHRSFLIPVATILGAAVLVATSGPADPLSRTLAPYFLAPPPVAPVFIAGFLAPRASYLLGGLLGVISQVVVIALLSSPAMQQAVTGTAGTSILQPDVLTYSLIAATVLGAFYAAAAAWYRRFLSLASPSRAKRTTGRPADRSRKRGPGDRPMLARRR